MKVYVSANDITEAKRVAARLRGLDHEVVSTWHDEPNTNDDPSRALRNFFDIDRADAYVGVVAPEKVAGGKFVEQGYALGKGKKCFLLGARRENLSSHHPGFALVLDEQQIV